MEQKDTLKQRLERLSVKGKRAGFSKNCNGCDNIPVSGSPRNLSILTILQKLRLKGYPALMIPVEFYKLLFIKGYRQVWNEILEEKRPSITSWGHGQGPFERCHSIAARRMMESRNSEENKRA